MQGVRIEGEADLFTGFDELAIDPLVLGVLDHVLGPHYQLSGPVGIDVGPLSW